MIEIPELPPYYEGYLWVTPAMKKFLEVFPGNDGVKVSVGLLAGFHPPFVIVPLSGWIEQKTPYIEENMYLKICFTCEQEWVDRNLAKIQNLQNSLSRSGNLHQHYNITTKLITVTKEITRGKFKKAQCDQIMALMGQAFPNMSNEDLIGFAEFNGLMWEQELPVENGEPYETYKHTYEQITQDKIVQVALIIQNCDLEANTSEIVEMLCSLKQKIL